MHVTPPKLRWHAKGYWICHWGGKDHCLGADKAEARKRYAKSLEQWAEWREAKDRHLKIAATGKTVAVLLKAFIETKALEAGQPAADYYAQHLKRFGLAFGEGRADLIGAQHLQGVKEEMLQQGYAPKTINHDVGAMKSFLNWCMDFSHVPAIRLNGVRSMPLDPPPSKAYPIETVCEMVEDAPPHMAAWLAVNYLCCMRPSEVIRVAAEIGDWVEDGIFEIANKVGRRTGVRRRVVFSNEALEWWDELMPHWSRLDSYSQAVRDFFGVGNGPGALRHSAATHLHRAGAARVDVDALLGHLPARVSLIYAPIEWQRLRETAARITLRLSA